MKDSSKHRSAKRRFVFIFTAVAAIVAVAAVTVISRQKATETSRVMTAEKSAGATAGKTFITRRVGGQDIQINTQTGEIKPLTHEEAQRLANGLAPMLDNSTDGLVQVRHADGSVSMDLEGRFQNVTVAKVSADGTVEQGCVDNPRAAAKFFGIDLKLIENAPTARKRANIQN